MNDQTDSAQLLHAARRQHDAGDLPAARRGYLQVLQQDSDNSEALHLLGNIDLRLGDLQSAEARILRAIELAPDAPGYQTSLGNVYRAAGRGEHALEAYRRELAACPDFAVAHQQVGLMMLERGEPEAAVQSLLRAVEYAPALATAHNHLGRAFNNLRKYGQAVNAFLSAIEQQPVFPEAYNNLGHVLRAQGNMAKAAEAFAEAVRQAPGNARAHHNLGTALAALSDASGAVQAFREAIRLDPKYADACHNLAVILHDKGLFEEALHYYDRSLGVDAGRADTLSSRAALLQLQGRLDEAERGYRDALEVQPHFPAALAGLSGLLHMQGRDEEGIALLDPRIAAGMRAPDVLGSYADLMRASGDTQPARAVLTQIIGHRGLSREQQMRLHFKLGDLCDADGDYEDAFENYRRANGLKQSAFDPRQHAARVDRIVEFFSASRCASAVAGGNDSRIPVFIVGMPRSGTSLVEQILASHPDIHGAGELNYIAGIAHRLGSGQAGDGLHDAAGDDTVDAAGPGTQQPGPHSLPWPASLERATAGQLASAADEYLAALRAHAPAARRISDKMWQNFEHLGLIAMLFPNARVIHCKRDPLDTALSCYFHNFFQTIALPFSYDLRHIGHYYLDYERLMAHWATVLPLPMLDVQYEALVSGQEPMSRALIDFVELPWDEACLRFHEARRVSLTASYAQVRKPMYSSSVGRWQHYEKHLQPLREMLDGGVAARTAKWAE